MESGKFNFSETAFKNLMQMRIYKVLILCSNFDFFMIEEDERIDEQIYNEYVSLNMRQPPVFVHASSVTEAKSIVQNEKIDIIISLYSTSSKSSIEFANWVKAYYKKIPFVLLTPHVHQDYLNTKQSDLLNIDYKFMWLGSSDIMLAIIKLIEDKMNLENDVQEGVRIILLVEDSVRFYSAYLPIIYRILLKQSRSMMKEGLNEYKEMLRMRGRPKIILTTNLEDAQWIIKNHFDNILGVISDIEFFQAGKLEKLAGINLHREIMNIDPTTPFLLQSSDAESIELAKSLNINCLNKFSPSLTLDLSNYLIENLEFGEFIFKDPVSQNQIDKAINLKEIHQKIKTLPDECLEYHFNRNDLSRWLYARALFPIAALIKHLTLEDFKKNVNSARKFIFNAISSYRISSGKGVIAKFEIEEYDEFVRFARIGSGSLGGKARGLAFIDSFLKKFDFQDSYPNVQIEVPRSIVLATDVFDRFMAENDLYKIALSDSSDQEIYQRFTEANFLSDVEEKLWSFLSHTKKPIAVRSSSLLEDSHYQPFAGVFNTYMVSNQQVDQTQFLRQIVLAIQSVYASVFFINSKKYMKATGNIIDEEKMAIILQEVCGNVHGEVFYPAFSGVARSVNFYPVLPEKSEDGVVRLSFGLGKIVVDGGQSLQFSPTYPKNCLQLSSTEMALKNTQSYFYALDLSPSAFRASSDDKVNLKKLRISQAEGHRSLQWVASTYDLQDNVIRDGILSTGRRLITFSNVLRHQKFPLANILKMLLEISKKEMNNSVEIEFAADEIYDQNGKFVFNFLQIRPLVEKSLSVNDPINFDKKENALIYSEMALGNGIFQNLYDIVYVIPEKFDSAYTKQIATEVEKLNDQMLEEEKQYILLGPGRWGSSDSWLGIPVKWAQICAAKLIIESGLENYRIDPSQGTHFFQNLTSFQVGYFIINPYNGEGAVDFDFLSKEIALSETNFVRHIRFKSELLVKIDGINNKGVVLRPKKY